MQDNALSRILNNTIFCPFHTEKSCSLNCFTEVSQSCPFFPHKGKVTILNS